MREKRIIVFDVDGTLVDTMSELSDLFCAMLEHEHGIPDSASRNIYVELAGIGPQAQFEAVLASAGLTGKALIDDLTARYWDAAEQMPVRAFPDSLSALDVLKQDGHDLLVSSGGTSPSVRRKLRVTGIEAYFQLALGTDEGVPKMRKGPGHFELIAEALAVTGSELSARGVFVGDSMPDMRVAREAKMLAVGRLTADNGDSLRKAGAQHLIQDLHEIRPLLEAL